MELITAPLRSVREVVAVFDDVDHLEDAIDELLSSGFDRAEVSLLAGERAIRERLGHGFENVAELEDDPRTPRSAYAPRTTIAEAQGAVVGALLGLGAIAAAGAVALNGGTTAATATAAALAGGLGGIAGGVLAKLIGRRHARYLQMQLSRGGLLLWVNLRRAEHEERAVRILESHKAHDLHVHGLAE